MSQGNIRTITKWWKKLIVNELERKKQFDTFSTYTLGYPGSKPRFFFIIINQIFEFIIKHSNDICMCVCVYIRAQVLVKSDFFFHLYKTRKFVEFLTLIRLSIGLTCWICNGIHIYLILSHSRRRKKIGFYWFIERPIRSKQLANK